MVRKRYQTLCEYNDAELKFPKPGDKIKGEHGYLQSLSFNKDIVVGRSYVTNVTADVPDGTYGYNAGVEGANTVPDVIDIKVAFSEPVVASCGMGTASAACLGALRAFWTTLQTVPLTTAGPIRSTTRAYTIGSATASA